MANSSPANDPVPGAGMAADGTRIAVTCPRHRTVETGLRCSRCGTPICPRCLVHSPVGARCPDCAKPTAGLSASPSAMLYLRSGTAGIGTAILAGVVLTFLNLGFLSGLLTILAGWLVGEAVSRASRRLPYRELAILAFGCAALGPTLGRALILAMLMPIPDPGVRGMLAITAAFQSLSAFGLLIAVLAGVVASTRVSRY